MTWVNSFTKHSGADIAIMAAAMQFVCKEYGQLAAMEMQANVGPDGKRIE
jgi:hypothetical protein